MSRAVKEYQEVNLHSTVMDADAHHLIQLLMQGALDKMALAKSSMLHKQVERKGINLSMAISIIDGLQSSLNREKGGEIAQNLYNLYDYMMRRLVESNLKNNPVLIDEVSSLMTTIKSGWDGIANEISQKQTN